MEKLVEQQHKRFKRRRVQNWFDEHLLRAETGVLDSLASASLQTIDALLAHESISEFSKALKDLKGCGDLTGIKCGFALQTLGALPLDDMPSVGTGENAYGYVRALCHNYFVNDPKGSLTQVP